MADAFELHRPNPGASADVLAPANGNGSSEVRGTVRIAPAVLIELIEMTVRDIEGVAGFRSRRKLKPPYAESPIGKSYDNGKIAVSVNGDQITADVSIAITRGTNVTGLGQEIQRLVGIAIGKMLGLTVQSVNVFVEEVVIGSQP